MYIGVTGWLNWWSVRLKIRRPKVQTPSGEHEKFDLEKIEITCTYQYNIIEIIIIVTDRSIYLNLSKETESAAELKALKPAASGRYWTCKSLPRYFHLLYRSTVILLSAKCMLGLFVFP